jgi:hypothetical protein
MASDWTALRELAAVAVEQSNHSASSIRDSYLNDDGNVVYASSHVCVHTHLFVFESLMNSTSRPRIFFHFPPAIFHNQEVSTESFLTSLAGELRLYLTVLRLSSDFFQILHIEGVRAQNMLEDGQK